MKITAAGKLVRITGEPDIDPEKSTLNHNLLHIKCSASASNAIYHQFPLLKEPKYYCGRRKNEGGAEIAVP
jgi:hypothetical protein